jgi:hypothetical protein
MDFEKLHTKSAEHTAKAAHHTRMAAHHEELASHHHELAACMGKTKSAEVESAHAIIKKIAEKHADLAAEHSAESERHTEHAGIAKKAEEAQSLSKRAPEDDLLTRFEKFLDRVEPSQISGVTPTRPGVTAVTRAGQQSIPVHAETILTKITSTEDGSDVSLTGAPTL